MTEQEFQEFLHFAITHYANENVRSGRPSIEIALEEAKKMGFLPTNIRMEKQLGPQAAGE